MSDSTSYIASLIARYTLLTITELIFSDLKFLVCLYKIEMGSFSKVKSWYKDTESHWIIRASSGQYCFNIKQWNIEWTSNKYRGRDN